MKTKHISISIISLIVLILCTTVSYAQNETTEKDTIVYKQKYGLRLGVDLSKLVRTFLDDDYTGFEINADYRLSKRLYLAGEIGTEERNTITDYLDITSKGSYFKAGVDFNLYRNWLNMENMIYSGFRVGVGSFSQTLNGFTVYNPDQYWNEPFSSNNSQEFSGLTAIWTELILGVKAEVITNLYVGLNVQLKGLVSQDESSNFENVYVPGFGKTYDSGRFGVGFGYNISYLVPFFKKDKKVVSED
ncbi:hypothetical protein A9Q87_11450 [Flavobacteriales bacterium 34_180_T64]|nr:hypothetical protein A9Q87_11450 [Flavobacteriales bacterium 34_180_T64]